MIENRIGFFLAQDIDPSIKDNSSNIDKNLYYDGAFIELSVRDIVPDTVFYKYLRSMKKIAQKHERCTHKFIKSILMKRLTNVVYNYFKDVSRLRITRSSNSLFTVDRYDNVIQIDIDIPKTNIRIKDNEHIFIDCEYKINNYEYKIISVDINRIFNSYYLAEKYSNWHKSRRNESLYKVLNDDAIYARIVSDNSNLNILIDFDSIVDEVEFSYNWDNCLTSEDDIKRFLFEADANIPHILERNQSIKKEKAFWKNLGKRVFIDSKNIE